MIKLYTNAVRFLFFFYYSFEPEKDVRILHFEYNMYV